MTQHYEYMIAGAGLAGLITALRFHDLNKSVCIIDKADFSDDSNGVPIALANYATGRFAKLTWGASNAMKYLKQDLRKIQNESSVQFYTQKGILRPALDQEIEDKMKGNFQETEWNEHTAAEWLSNDELKSFNPYIRSSLGGLWVIDGCVVNIRLFLSEIRRYLSSAGVTFIKADVNELNQKDTGWALTDSDYDIQVMNLIVCTGAASNHPILKLDLPIHPVKGQLLVFEREEPIPFQHSVSALGYFGIIDAHRFAVGSTYEHKYDNLDTTEEGRIKLIKLLKHVLPELSKGSNLTEQWAGLRASTPNRLPIIGRHPALTNTFYFTGLGSKGLMYSSIGSRMLIEHILEELPIPKEFDINRFDLG